ncbi:amino acid/amide ABC transporter ATP-binding protein 1 (HAAT family) [Primorskyibacter sedentarius]|uniref:Amino acid/amide ABC transporter ATP-binding protein 1 (HAAT family) n=1 Tax=Primorskyibacter sedentarius TaxID=745311 RepID=A0A4R3JN16_9RHOB|nr:ABC transporter ATP-binding protein [Primorskyibacter sedentarius]TCS67044.1 amino acid/amide ABC transporter ATP-binding protein 1 (HAAT family) [Primorskyibacter sedentarius]
MSALLEIQSLNKGFGGIKASDDLSLSVEAGEVHAIIGPNGAGKTTLLSQLSGGQKPDIGRILFKGRDLVPLPAHARAHLGIARSFQITSLIMDMSVLDNVALAVQARQGHSFRFLRAARQDASLREGAMGLLRRVGLEAKAQLPTRALSHGEHRHMEIAIALAGQAELLLLDEPMAGLGGEESAHMVTLLRQIKSRHTILLVEHDMDAVFQLADRISVLVYGHVIATGTPDEIRANAAVQHAYLGEE